MRPARHRSCLLPRARGAAVALATVLASVLAVAGCGSGTLDRVAAVSHRTPDTATTPDVPAPTAPAHSAVPSATPTRPAVTTAVAAPPTTDPPTTTPAAVPTECRLVTAAAVAAVVDAPAPPTTMTINPGWCRYGFDTIGNEYVDVTLFPGAQGNSTQGVPVPGLRYPAWWNAGGNTLSVQFPNGVAWIAVALSARLRHGVDPRDVAVAILARAAPRLP